MTSEEHFRKLERMYLSSPENEYYKPGIRVEEGRAEIVVPIRRCFFHAAGAAHGSVYFKALDDAAFFAVNSYVTNVFVLTVTFNMYLMRPISEGEVRATGRVTSLSKHIFVAESELVDAEGKQLARGSGTFTRSKIPLAPEIGYM